MTAWSAMQFAALLGKKFVQLFAKQQANKNQTPRQSKDCRGFFMPMNGVWPSEAHRRGRYSLSTTKAEG